VFEELTNFELVAGFFADLASSLFVTFALQFPDCLSALSLFVSLAFNLFYSFSLDL